MRETEKHKLYFLHVSLLRLTKAAENRWIFLFILCALSSGFLFIPSGMPSANAGSRIPDPAAGIPDLDTQQKLEEIWLRFHKDNLCEDVDAAFVLDRNRMEVLVNVENKKGSEKLLKMLEPLYRSHRIDLRTVKVQMEKDLIDISNPPPSFWVNSRLTRYFGDSGLMDSVFLNMNMGSRAYLMPRAPTFSFGQRILGFARDILENNRKMKRYAAHLPALACVAFNPEAKADLRNQALDICRAHARKLEKYTKNLSNDLIRVLPKTSEASDKTVQARNQSAVNISSIYIATRLAAEAQDLSLQVYRFLYPKNHTVGLDDLRHPKLLQSMEKLQKRTEEFQNAIGSF